MGGGQWGMRNGEWGFLILREGQGGKVKGPNFKFQDTRNKSRAIHGEGIGKKEFWILDSAG